MVSTRRELLQRMAGIVGATLLLPTVSACGGRKGASLLADGDPATRIPRTITANWDPIRFNQIRGNAGFIPESYLPQINGPTGARTHIGMHLPYRVLEDDPSVPDGYIAMMWGDPNKGYSAHPQARRGPANNYEGHWFHWIRVRKATLDDAEELQSTFSEWPVTTNGDNGRYAVHGGASIEADRGVKTVYLVALPTDVEKGDIVRVHARCLQHGEYVDFLRV